MISLNRFCDITKLGSYSKTARQSIYSTKLTSETRFGMAICYYKNFQNVDFAARSEDKFNCKRLYGIRLNARHYTPLLILFTTTFPGRSIKAKWYHSISEYRKNSKYWDICIWANSVDSDQTALKEQSFLEFLQ